MSEIFFVGMQTRLEQNVMHVRVPDAADIFLVHQKSFDLHLFPVQKVRKMLKGEPFIKRIDRNVLRIGL
jgi:hypothetical protein